MPTVSNRSELLSALSSARGGETIVLKDGNYGSIRITADYASTVTIRAEDRHDATISNLELFGSSNLAFDGINFYSGGNGGNGRGIISMDYGTKNIQVINSNIGGSDDGIYEGHYGVFVRNGNSIDLKNNSIQHVDSGIVVFGASGVDIENNRIDYFGRDAMKFAGMNASEVQDNISYGYVFRQSAGVHNDFIQFQGSSNNVLIEGNVFLPTTASNVQGIFLNDGTYNDVKIDNNIIYTGMFNGIYISNGSRNAVTNNTVLDVPNEIHNATKILVPGGTLVSNNIWSGYTAGLKGSNLEVQNRSPDQPFYVDDFFQNGSAGRGVTLRDLLPVAGSLAETKGAIGRLKELLGGGSAPAPAPEPAPQPAPSAPAPVDPDGDVAINAGGGGSSGFASDAFFSGGNKFSTGASIANTGADAIYQTERWGTFDYSVGLQNGTYDVTLKFAEIYHGAAGRRLFDVRAEDTLVLNDFDVYKAAGGKNIAIDRTFRVDVRDGDLDLAFDAVRDQAKISGIEIAPASGSAPAPAPAPTGGGTELAVNAGGPAAAGFGADAYFSGGRSFSTGSSIANTGADAIYQSERWGTFDFSAPVKNGTYDVTLKFAEIYHNQAGKRVFDVKAENKMVLDDYDVFREAGGKNVAVDETFKVSVSDGRLDLDFISVVENAKVSGIEIAPSDGFDFL